MNPAFQFNSYLLKRQVFALTGKFRLYDPSGNLLLFSEQKMFRLREDIRVYNDEARSQEMLVIKARQIIDFSAAYDVIDSAAGQKVGALRRKGWKSLLRDEWEVLDLNDTVVGLLFEELDQPGAAAPLPVGLAAAPELRHHPRLRPRRGPPAALQPICVPARPRLRHGYRPQAGSPSRDRRRDPAGSH